MFSMISDWLAYTKLHGRERMPKASPSHLVFTNTGFKLENSYNRSNFFCSGERRRFDRHRRIAEPRQAESPLS
jgi:hypothetical protein